MLIETERLIITKFTPDMAQVVCGNSVDEDNRRFAPDEVWETKEETEEVLEFLISQYGTVDGPLVYPIILKDTKNNIGYLALTAKYEKEQQEAKKYVARTEIEVQTAKQETADLNIFLNAIRRCTDLTELTPTLVNTLIKKIEVFNSEVGADGIKHVPIKVHFRSVDIVTVPDEEVIIAAMEEIRKNPTNVA